MKCRTIDEYRRKTKKYVTEKISASFRVNPKTVKKIEKNFRDYLRYHRQYSSMRLMHQKGKRISEKNQKRLIKNALASERCFKTAINTSLEVMINNIDYLKHMQKYILNNFEEVGAFANPIFFDRTLRKKIIGLGMTMKELRGYYNIYFRKDILKVLKKAMKEKPLKTQLQQVSKNIIKAPYSESTSRMRELGMITINGNEGIEPYIVGACMIVVGAAITYYAPWLGVGEMLIMDGGYLITEETIQWVTGTQDDSWTFYGTEIPFWHPQLPIISIPYTPVEFPDPHSHWHQYMGYFIGNHNPSKMEVHIYTCPYLHLMNPEHIRLYTSLEEAHAAGLDNCYYCIGGSTR